MKKIQRGFTLLELMVTMAIVGILAAIALWDSSDRLQEDRAENYLLEIQRNLQYARAKAIATDSLVMACYISQNSVIRKRLEVCFYNGEINTLANEAVLVTFHKGEQGPGFLYRYNHNFDTILRTTAPLPEGDKVSYIGDRRIVFDASGRLKYNSRGFVYCPGSDNKNNKELVITESGRALYKGDTDKKCT